MESTVTEQLSCPICRNTKHKHLHRLTQGELVRCQNCHLVLFTPRPTFEDLANFYNTSSYRDCYQNSTMAEINFARERYRHLKYILNRYDRNLQNRSIKIMLDIGCGEGHLLKIATEDGWQITGTEISVKATETANQLLENKVLAGDILDLNLPDNSFDLITIYHVIEHLIEPIPTLEKIKQLLKPNGIAFIETPNIGSLGARIKGKKWSHIIPPEHISYFDRHSLKQALKTAEFSQYHVFTTAPQTINSIANWVEPIKSTATAIYNLAPILGLGAELQAVAFKEVI